MPDYNDAERIREAWRAQIAENSARLAYAWGTATTTGVGSFPYADHVDFDLSFVEMPIFSYGYVITDLDGGASDIEDRATNLPQASGFVYEWVQDGKGLYVGAHVGVVVSLLASTTSLPSDGSKDVLEHHFTFMGTALKDLDIPETPDGDTADAPQTTTGDTPSP